MKTKDRQDQGTIGWSNINFQREGTMKIIRKSDSAGPLLESEGGLIELLRYLCSCSHDVVIDPPDTINFS